MSPRGVDVKLVLPGNTDTSLTLNAGKYFCSKLLKSWVKLYERRDVLLHAKTLVIDGVWSTVGSTNMDFRSFSSNDEVNAVILNKDFAAEMEKMFARDVAESHEIRLAEWNQRPLLPRIREWLAHQFKRWLQMIVEEGWRCLFAGLITAPCMIRTYKRRETKWIRTPAGNAPP